MSTRLSKFFPCELASFLTEAVKTIGTFETKMKEDINQSSNQYDCWKKVYEMQIFWINSILNNHPIDYFQNIAPISVWNPGGRFI